MGMWDFECEKCGLIEEKLYFTLEEAKNDVCSNCGAKTNKLPCSAKSLLIIASDDRHDGKKHYFGGKYGYDTHPQDFTYARGKALEKQTGCKYEKRVYI